MKINMEDSVRVLTKGKALAESITSYDVEEANCKLISIPWPQF